MYACILTSTYDCMFLCMYMLISHLAEHVLHGRELDGGKRELILQLLAALLGSVDDGDAANVARNNCVCMYACMYIHMYACMYVSMYARDARAILKTLVSTNVCTYMEICMYICMHACMYVYMHEMRVLSLRRLCRRTYVHIHT